MAGIAVVLSWGSHEERLTTNGVGLATCDVRESANARVSFPDLAAIAEALKPRWDRVLFASWGLQGLSL